MSILLTVFLSAAILVCYAKGKINVQSKAAAKWHRFFEAGSIRRM